jgi:hypothetical protein
MAKYMVRIELHGASYFDYERLHGEMKTEGFDRTIVSDTGIKYHLPLAEYYCSTSLTSPNVLESVRRAVARTSKVAGITVAESSSVRWDGLERA